MALRWRGFTDGGAVAVAGRKDFLPLPPFFFCFRSFSFFSSILLVFCFLLFFVFSFLFLFSLSPVYSLSLFGLLSLSSLRFFPSLRPLQLRFSSLFIGAEPWGTIVSAVQRLVGQC